MSSTPESPGLRRRIHLWGVRNPKLYYIFPPSLWAVGIYVLSLMPADRLEPATQWAFPGADKIVHAGLYAVLALLIVRGWQREKMPPLDLHGFVWILCLVYGTMIEMLQAMTPSRGFELWDIGADALGALAGLVIWHAAMIRWGRRTRLYPGLFRPEYKTSPANPKNRSRDRDS